MLDKKYDFTKSEQKWQMFWEQKGIYRFDPYSSKSLYSIDTPPPTVSGDLHIGHIFSYTQAEMIARYHRMRGKNVFYPFGFDDNGLPTERLVEHEEHLNIKNLPRSEFIQRCRHITVRYEKEFTQLWKSLGFSVDWSLQYETINPLSQKISQKSFLDLYKKGKAYRQETPTLWCTICQTSIAQAELDSQEKPSTFNWIPFLVEDQELLIATTRPELLYGCVALFIYPEDEKNKKWIGKEAIVPLFHHTIPILSDQRVDPNKGSGIVMCATFGDTVDMEWIKAYHLPYRKVIEPDGTITPGISWIGGLKVLEARERIIQLLKEHHLLKKSESILHQVGIHERCGHDIEILPSPQWYIRILEEKEKFLQAGDEIQWYPSLMKNRYRTWVENLKWDWCISRQRYYGVPFPIWYCKSCGNILVPDEADLPIQPMETAPKSACSCGSREYIPEEAVLDTWATSSLTPLINAHWGEANSIQEQLLPMTMRTQAHEIIRTWAFYTIVKSYYHTGKIPWKNVMICGFVLAKKGEKISKSKSNAVSSPKELIASYSADALRYWAANARLGTDTMFSEDELQGVNRMLVKLWNAARFTFLHLQDHTPMEKGNLQPIDHWMLERLKEVETQCISHLEQYEIGLARHEVDEFFWKDYCDNYLEIVKERLYQPERHGEMERRGAQYTLYHVFLGILRLYAIYIPHITEEIYQSFYIEHEKHCSLHQQQWCLSDDVDHQLLSFGELMKEIVAFVRKYKSERNLSLKTAINRLDIEIPHIHYERLSAEQKDLTACTQAARIQITMKENFRILINEQTTSENG